MSLTLSVLPDRYAVCQLPPDTPLPAWALNGWFSITRTDEELSLVCAQQHIPANISAERDWRVLKIHGPLDFGLVGVLAAIAQPLAQAHISIFAVSTFNTDYVLVKAATLDHAIATLREGGHTVV